MAGYLAGTDLWTTEQYDLWNLVDAVPLLDALGTLAWDEPRILAGQGSGGLLLLHLEHVRPGAAPPAALDAAHSFAALLRNLQLALDDVERLRRTHPERTGNAAPDDSRYMEPPSPPRGHCGAGPRDPGATNREGPRERGGRGPDAVRPGSG